ncbi:MAG: hypothetical protein QME46_03945 [Thermoanaerobacteraceae bacterium]|nr:hypothetical protein [Thermoanaerobacteraceae bacterium]
MDSYKRSYITLKIIDKEGTSGGTARGYAKIEKRGDKGVLTLYAENLEGNLEYNGFIVSVNNDMIKYIDFGGIKIDPGGIGNLKESFDANNIDGKGFNIYEISAVGLITPDYDIPLVGYTTNEISDIKDKILRCLKRTEDPAPESHESNTPGSEAPQTPETEKQEENLEKEYIETTGEEKVLEVVEEPPAPEKAFTQGIGEEKFIENAGSLASEIDNYMTSLKKYIGNIVNYLQEVKPFEWEIPGYRWWRIDLSFTDSIYDHYLVGFYYENDDIKYLVYGMPGRFCIQEQPFGGMTGFVYWHPAKGKERKFGEEGYWILHIDAATGRIIVPLMPTPPPLFS